jgi:hypothetical protein
MRHTEVKIQTASECQVLLATNGKINRLICIVMTCKETVLSTVTMSEVRTT